ncbi:hypothetical protein ACFFHJ_09475 [Planotetraspora thailandica]|nr:hypothetical protein [Planotetraspora thailandica]
MVTNLHRVLSRHPEGRAARRHAVAGAVSGLLAIGLLSACQTADTSATSTASVAASASAPSPAATGLAALSSKEAFEQALKASGSAKSLHLRGAVKESDGTYKVDIKMVPGKGGAGYITINGQRLDLTVIGKTAYMKGDKAFWTSAAGKDAASLLVGKYIKMTSTQSDFKDLISMFELDGLLGEVAPSDGATTLAEVDGTPAVAIKAEDGSTVYVAAEGDPYILRVGGPDGGSQNMDFLDYGKAVTLKAPPAGDVIDIGKLG